MCHCCLGMLLEAKPCEHYCDAYSMIIWVFSDKLNDRKTLVEAICDKSNN